MKKNTATCECRARFLGNLEAPDLKGILDGIIEDVVAWTGPEQSDDYTLIAMRVADDDCKHLRHGICILAKYGALSSLCTAYGVVLCNGSVG